MTEHLIESKDEVCGSAPTTPMSLVCVCVHVYVSTAVNLVDCQEASSRKKVRVPVWRNWTPPQLNVESRVWRVGSGVSEWTMTLSMAEGVSWRAGHLRPQGTSKTALERSKLSFTVTKRSDSNTTKVCQAILRLCSKQGGDSWTFCSSMKQSSVTPCLQRSAYVQTWQHSKSKRWHRMHRLCNDAVEGQEEMLGCGSHERSRMSHWPQTAAH